MRDEYFELLPQWVNDDCELDLVLTDDIDSLASCCLLNEVKGWNIKYFYTFEQLFYSAEINRNDLHSKCYVDCAVAKGKAFDNHVSALSLYDEWNQDMVNLNMMHMVSNENYGDKYSGSTLLEIWSIFNKSLPKTEEGLMMLLTIDSSYLGFFRQNFHEIQRHYLVDVLGFPELYECILRHKEEEFKDLDIKYGVNKKKIVMSNKNHLFTSLDIKKIGDLIGLKITVPKDTYKVLKEFEITEDKVRPYQQEATSCEYKVFSYALTYKNSYRCSHEKAHKRKENDFMAFLRGIKEKEKNNEEKEYCDI